MYDTIPPGTARDAFESGEASGEIKGKAETILTVLYARFKHVPLEVNEKLCKMTDSTALDSLAALAATCDSVADFAKALE